MKRAVVYFSATGVTRKVAQIIAKECHVPLIEILPKDPYSTADLDWTMERSRSSLETKDPHSRPEIVDQTLDTYDEIFLGFPIWWFMAPKIVHTFLEAYDFSNKKIIVFATSDETGFGKTLEDLQTSVPDSVLIEGQVFHTTDPSAVKAWLNS